MEDQCLITEKEKSWDNMKDELESCLGKYTCTENQTHHVHCFCMCIRNIKRDKDIKKGRSRDNEKDKQTNTS